jgi:hypothetical protein
MNATKELEPARQTILLSLQPQRAKLFFGKRQRNNLLIVDSVCIRESPNRLLPGDTCRINIRPTTKINAAVSDDSEVATVVAQKLVPVESMPLLEKGTWANADTTTRFLIRAEEQIDRNRRGVRTVECVEFLRVLENDEANDGEEDDDENDLFNKRFAAFGIEDDSLPQTEAENCLSVKSERHRIFAHWLVETYGVELLSKGSGVLDVAGGNGEISRTLHELGVPSTLLDPNPRCREGSSATFGVLPYPLNGDGTDLTGRDDQVGDVIRQVSFICGMHPDQATEPIVALALRLGVSFAVLPCCVMPSLFPHRIQKRHGDPVRSYSTFCQYLLDMEPEDDGTAATRTRFLVDHLPFVGRNKVIYSTARTQ